MSGQENHENIPNKNLPRMSTRNSPNVSGQENINVVNVQGTAKNFQTARKPKVLNLPLKKPSPLTSMPNIYWIPVDRPGGHGPVPKKIGLLTD